MNDSRQTEGKRKRRISPAVALWFIAPIFGELFSGSAPLNEYLNPITILLFGMLYGSGAILIREFIVRFKKGWISLLLMGMAYGIYEEGLMVRSFFDPHWVDLGKLGEYGRAAGVNWVWTEHLTIYHALISITASIVFVEMLYPKLRKQSWAKTRGIIFHSIAFTATLLVGALINPYDAPDYWLGACWLAIIGLVVAAWQAPTGLKESAPHKCARPRRFLWFTFMATFVYHFLLYWIQENNSPHFVVSMLLIAVYWLFMLWLIYRWSGNFKGWDDRHKLALIIGGLSFFLVIGPLTTGAEVPILYYSNPLFLVLLWLAYRKVNKRVNIESEDSTAVIQ
ncbi:MAG: hypothetical protein JEZ00_16845 [Anaerolineaceae bacterium]|nr:hypothetical protein [Anaerolineaceae bacterium]